jgi:hypothetical protein
VTVKPLQGEAVRGSLLELSEKTLAIRSASGEVKWDSRAVQSVKPVVSGGTAAAEEMPLLNLFVELTDETSLVGSGFTLDSGKGVLEFPEGTKLDIPNRLIRSLRFRRQDDELQKQWNAIAAAESSGDQLVVRKVSGEKEEEAAASVVLDQLEGVVHAVTPRTVTFEFDGDRIDVPLEKVEGVLFRQRQSGPAPDPICRVEDSLGGEWNVRSIQFVDGTLTLETVSALRAELPWNRVVEVDFTAGNLVYLSDLKPASVEWRPYLLTPATPPALAKWFSLRRDQLIDGSVLTLGGESFEKGLAIHSRTLISYRLTKEFRRFQARTGVDERFRGTANLQLVITGDDRILLSREVRGSDPPFDIDLDMSGVRRLKVLVDFGQDRSDAGDHLLLCNARLTK